MKDETWPCIFMYGLVPDTVNVKLQRLAPFKTKKTCNNEVAMKEHNLWQSDYCYFCLKPSFFFIIGNFFYMKDCLYVMGKQ